MLELALSDPRFKTVEGYDSLFFFVRFYFVYF